MACAGPCPEELGERYDRASGVEPVIGIRAAMTKMPAAE
jgi:hypothetical protein